MSEVSDNDDDDKPSDQELEVVDLEWDDALADWEDEVDSSAEAQSAPLPQRNRESSPLYRPPSPDDTFARRSPVPRAPVQKPAPGPGAFLDFDDDELESTRIAAIPQELINSLVAKGRREPGSERGSERGNERPTRPPPSTAPAVDLDLDGLLDGFDAEPRSGPRASTIGGAAEPLPNPPLPIPRSAPTPSPDVVTSFTAGEAWDDDDDARTRIAAPLPRAAALAQPDEDEVEEPRTRIAAPLPKPSALDALDEDDEEDEEPRTRIAAPLPKPSALDALGEDDGEDDAEEDEEPRTRIAAPLPKPSALDDDEGEDDEEPRTRIAAPLSKPSALDALDALDDAEDDEEPRTRIAAPLPKPSALDDEDGPTMQLAVPVVAKPSLPRPGVPRPPAPPSGARPPLPRPGLPPIPSTGARPAIPRPPPPAIPRPGGHVASPGAPSPGVPRPGVPKPAVPRPGLPRPGVPGAPSPAALVVPPPTFGGAVPRPDAPPARAALEAAVPSAIEDDDLDALLGLSPSSDLESSDLESSDLESSDLESSDLESSDLESSDLEPGAASPVEDAAPGEVVEVSPATSENTGGLELADDAPAGEEPALAAEAEASDEPTGDESPSELDARDADLVVSEPAAPEPTAPLAAADAVVLAEPEARAEGDTEAEAKLEALADGVELASEPEADTAADEERVEGEAADGAEPLVSEPLVSEPLASELETDLAEADAELADDDAELADDDAEPADDDAEPADDDAELAVFESDEDELAVSTDGDEDDEDEDWEALEAAADAEAAAEQQAASPDRGALAARRSVRSRKPRDEVFPMVGSGAEALRLRQRLLHTLAEPREGGVRARLLVGAAEISEQLGESERARELYQSAIEADPTDVVALRALRRDALARGAWDELAQLFAKEAQLALSPSERALALTGLAELELGRRGDAKAAAEAAAQALELEPRSAGARLLLMEAGLAQGDRSAALRALGPAVDVWDDGRAQATLQLTQARHAERRGEVEQARTLFQAAAELDPDALDARLGVARTATRIEPRAAVASLATVAERMSGPVRDALRTRASRIATLAGEPATGVALLADAVGVLPLRARAEAALASGDRAAERAALAAWATAAGGTERALALVRVAETLAQDGDLDGAESALRDAALADGSLGLVRVVREVIARRAGDMSRLVAHVEAGGSLAAAARIASSGDAERERELLSAAVEEGTALVTADVLSLDVAAALGDEDGLTEALRRQADRTPPDARVGSLLALADRALQRGETDTAQALLQEARSLSPGDPVVLRPLGRLAVPQDATAVASIWMEEASSASGSRAAFCATEAARTLRQADGDALGALRRALDAERGYGPAAWLTKPLSMEVGDILTLGEVHEQLADTAADATDAAGHLVRAAMLRAEADPDGAAALLGRAREAAPSDAVLQSLSMRLSGASPAERAAMLSASASTAPATLARVFRLQAAAAYEDVADDVTAAALYRQVALTHPEDAVVRLGLDRAEIAAGEVARVAERRFTAVKEASDDEQRVAALERLADLDMHERRDAASAVLSLQSILEVAPGHLPSLRALQRYFTEQGRTDEAALVVEALAEHLVEGPDVTSHLRLARRLQLARPEAAGEAADAMLLRLLPRAELDLWLAPRVLGAARAQDVLPAAQSAARRTAELLSGSNERASARLRAAELLDATAPEAALELLHGATQSAPLHPVAALALAERAEQSERWAEAAEAWEEAGRASEVRPRAAAMFLRAGRLWEERLGDRDRALKAYELATMRDVGHGDAFARHVALLESVGDKARLAELYGLRVAAGGDDGELIELYVKQAQLHRELRDLANAKSALRAALALAPERLDALRGLADLCLEDEDWRGAAEVLIRVARVRKEREELRWVFFTLGDIYDQHMPDPQRAEAAFKRVLKLLPEDVPSMERLAALYQREGQHASAAEILTDLARLDVDPDRNRAHRLELAETYERLGDARRSEQVLEDARKNAPTDLVILRAMVELYRRQSASNAMGMHLNRAVNDFRHALETDLGDAAAWPGLVEVLGWRGDADAAAAAASTAQALGIVDLEMSKCVDARGSAPPLGAGAALEVLDELLAPAQLPAPMRAVFRLAGEALERSLPFDLSAYRAEKINPRDTLIRPIAMEVGRWFGIPEPQIYVTSAAPRVCVPVYSNPPTVLIGSELLGITDDREKVFVLVRALKIAHAQLSVVVRAQPQELLALVGGLVQSYDPRHTPTGADPALVAEAGRRIAKNLARKARDELGPLVFEMAGRPGYDPARFAMAASEWGNRTGLIASGSAPAAFTALAKLSGERELPPDVSARMTMLQRFPEAASLLAFSVSDAHFEARRRAAGR